jgi:hypothetical protein
MAARIEATLSRKLPKPWLQQEHSTPRTAPVTWSWSTCSGTRSRQRAQRPPCAATIASKSAEVMPYLRLRWYSRVLPYSLIVFARVTS